MPRGAPQDWMSWKSFQHLLADVARMALELEDTRARLARCEARLAGLRALTARRRRWSFWRRLDGDNRGRAR